MTARLWIIRHGNTFEAGEPPRRIGARTDLPLTAAGRAQAMALADRFARDGVRFDRVLAGPLARTRETAALLRQRVPEIAGWLAEIDHGPDEGADEAAVAARIGADALDRWDRDAVPPPGWIVDADARRAAWLRLFGDAAGDHALVTSNGAARFALSSVAGRPPSLRLRTGAWGRIDVAGGTPRLIEWDMRP